MTMCEGKSSGAVKSTVWYLKVTEVTRVTQPVYNTEICHNHEPWEMGFQAVGNIPSRSRNSRTFALSKKFFDESANSLSGKQFDSPVSTKNSYYYGNQSQGSRA